MCKCLLCLLAVVIPPLAVLLDQGCTADFCLNVCLTIFFFIPGVLHAWYVILSRNEQIVTNIYIAENPQRGDYGAPPVYSQA